MAQDQYDAVVVGGRGRPTALLPHVDREARVGVTSPAEFFSEENVGRILATVS